MTLAPRRLKTTTITLTTRYGVAAYIAALVIVPLLALIGCGFSQGLAHFLKALSGEEAKAALLLTIETSLTVAVISGVCGTVTAWVLGRYKFIGRQFLTSLIDLPLAIPTLVTGILLVLLFGPTSVVGRWFISHDMPIVYATPGIVLALGFVTLPFVVRAVQPVIVELDLAEEEAAATLGAGRITTFVKIIFPSLLPAILCGTVQCFARAMAEFGSIVVVSGNIPYRTLTAPVFIYGQVESGMQAQAAAVSLVLLVIALTAIFASAGIKTLFRRWNER